MQNLEEEWPSPFETPRLGPVERRKVAMTHDDPRDDLVLGASVWSSRH